LQVNLSLSLYTTQISHIHMQNYYNIEEYAHTCLLHCYDKYVHLPIYKRSIFVSGNFKNHNLKNLFYFIAEQINLWAVSLLIHGGRETK
jgi:hypothetical protein